MYLQTDSFLSESGDFYGTSYRSGKEVKAMSKKSVKVGRSAVTGKFTTVKTAIKKPNTHVVETIKRP